MLLCLPAPWPAPSLSPTYSLPTQQRAAADGESSARLTDILRAPEAFPGWQGTLRLEAVLCLTVTAVIVSIASQYKVQLAFGQMTELHRIWKKGKESWKSLVFFVVVAFVTFIYDMFLCVLLCLVCVCTHGSHGSQRTACRTCFSSSITWAWGTNLGCEAWCQMPFLNVPSSLDGLEEFRLVIKCLPSLYPWRKWGGEVEAYKLQFNCRTEGRQEGLEKLQSQK